MGLFPLQSLRRPPECPPPCASFTSPHASRTCGSYLRPVASTAGCPGNLVPRSPPSDPRFSSRWQQRSYPAVGIRRGNRGNVGDGAERAGDSSASVTLGEGSLEGPAVGLRSPGVLSNIQPSTLTRMGNWFGVNNAERRGEAWSARESMVTTWESNVG